MLQLLSLSTIIWQVLLKETAVFPILASAIFILILLITFTLFIARSRDNSDF